MDIIRAAINKPISVAVGVILVILFGSIGISQLPLQMTPEVQEPKISVSTVWPGAAPTEVEQEIIERQEDKLKGLKNLVKMESSSYSDMGSITLTFEVGVDIDNSLLRVSNKLDEVSGYPQNVEKPILEASGAEGNPVAWIMLKTSDKNGRNINTFKTYFEENLKQQLERVEGVGSLFIGGGTEKQLKIEIDTQKLARHNITINQVISAVRAANSNVSAGELDISKNSYRIRTVSRFQKPEDALETVVFDDGATRVKLKDIGDAAFGYEKVDFVARQNGENVIAIGVRKEPGTNVVKLTERVKERIEHMNETVLKDLGLYFDLVHDDSPYILKSIDLVRNNVLIGALLAVMILFVFLRSPAATLTTAVAIPISAMGTFIFLWAFGRNINVVSLAGIAFAVGMLVDNAIVSLENIDRHRMMGKSAFQAAHDGVKEVWGAILASTATTVAVFLPIIFMEEEAGQLFKDIAIAITFSIVLSLVVSITVIPSLLNRLYLWREKRGKARITEEWKHRKKSLLARFDVLAHFGRFVSYLIITVSGVTLKNWFTRIVCVVIMTLAAVYIAKNLAPEPEYLPTGNRNLILTILVPPPGISVEKRRSLANYIEEQTAPYMNENGADGLPGIEDLWFISMERFTIAGGVSHEETRAKELIPLFTRVVNSIPDMFGHAFQTGLFQQDLGGGRTIDVDLRGDNLQKMASAGQAMYGAIMQAVPGSQIRPIPSLETSYPEARIVPDKEKLAASGLDERMFGRYVDIIMDGRKIDEYRPEGKTQLDLVLTAQDTGYKTPEDLMDNQIVNSYGDLGRIGDFADLEYASGMTTIRHLERKRNITLQVTPPDDLPLQAAMNTIQDKVVRSMKEKEMFSGIDIQIGGNADKLVTTMNALKWNLLLAVAIIYLLMSALFENFIYPFIILFTVPLAAAGGFIGLRLVNFIAPQPLDILAMLGFIILVGTVVNNAILIVHQSLNNVRYEKMAHLNAVSESVKTRIRPIFMSTITTTFGMLPLVISTGAGSELYRGLGSILLGGLVFSTMFTLFLIPALLAFFIKMEKAAA